MGRLDILKNSNNKIVQEDVYKSHFDFQKFEIEDESIKQEISLKEEEIINTAKQIARKTLDLGRMLYEMQQILSNFKNGTFVGWFNYMGIDKNTVYREINRWELFQRLKNPQIAEASVRTIDFIKKHEEQLAEIKISEILEDPKDAPKKIKSIVNENKTIIAKETNIEFEIVEIDEKIEKLRQQIRKLEEKKQKLKNCRR